MLFDYRYLGASTIKNSANEAQMSFVPDASRTPTFFRGRISAERTVLFREAISALHQVVLDDQRYAVPDRTEYLLWRKEQDLIEFQRFLADELGIKIEDKDLSNLQDRVAAKNAGIKGQLKGLFVQRRDYEDELKDVMKKIDRKHFWSAVNKYYSWLYKANKAAWYVLDPVITVHPDTLFFECFSMDEASYGKLSLNYSNFDEIDEFECGTTNIDYSVDLYNEFQKLRDYRTTELEVDPSGFTVKTEHEEDFKEVKIDLPDTWIRGFLQVSTSMSLPATKIRLDPLDVHALCLFLRKHKELTGPRSIRFKLKPGEPVVVSFDPWNKTLVFPRSTYFGDKEQEIRVWGRRRLHILERLIPIAKYFDLHLLGTGLPYFFIANLGGLNFTLGLSGWSSNNFSGGANFDLLAPRDQVTLGTKALVFSELKSRWYASAEDLAKALNLDTTTVSSALTAYMQAGRVVYDLSNNLYRARELSRDPLPVDALRFSSPKEAEAVEIVNQGRVSNLEVNHDEGNIEISGSIRGTRGGNYRPVLTLNGDGRIIPEGTRCNCEAFFKSKVLNAPCAHLLALRLHHSRSERA